ncbi:hypothetical protein WMY93_018187 [Mugilogobius chulae]|uniref:Uncharacterized protein n=1 Tax=Mugilogobius chulae TaxID=88201 RepID=A0AAW0NKV9_9GOBI
MQFCRKVLCKPCSARVTSPEEDMEYKMGSCIGIANRKSEAHSDTSKRDNKPLLRGASSSQQSLSLSQSLLPDVPVVSGVVERRGSPGDPLEDREELEFPHDLLPSLDFSSELNIWESSLGPLPSLDSPQQDFHTPTEDTTWCANATADSPKQKEDIALLKKKLSIDLPDPVEVGPIKKEETRKVEVSREPQLPVQQVTTEDLPKVDIPKVKNEEVQSKPDPVVEATTTHSEQKPEKSLEKHLDSQPPKEPVVPAELQNSGPSHTELSACPPGVPPAPPPSSPSDFPTPPPTPPKTHSPEAAPASPLFPPPPPELEPIPSTQIHRLHPRHNLSDVAVAMGSSTINTVACADCCESGQQLFYLSLGLYNIDFNPPCEGGEDTVVRGERERESEGGGGGLSGNTLWLYQQPTRATHACREARF